VLISMSTMVQLLCLPHNSDEMKLELDAVPSPEELQQTMQLSNIVTMASSPANHPVVKFFFYAQHVSCDLYCLIGVHSVSCRFQHFIIS